MENKTNLVTIIVPIYNVEKYLFECLNSFVEQTSKDFHVILVNDGSTDGSKLIALQFVEKYPDLFEYIEQENKGLGGARNTGLDNVKTKYTMFFDSDDFMANRTIEKINEHIKLFETDIIFFNPVIYDMANNSYEKWHDSNLIEKIFKKQKLIDPKKHPELHSIEASVCRAFWKTEFLKRINLRFLEKIHWEDVPPHFLIMHEANSASFFDYKGAYYYRINSSGQITKSSGKDRLDMSIIFKEIEPLYGSKQYSSKEKTFMISFLSKYVFWSLHVIDDKYRHDFVDICHDFFKSISFGQYVRFFFHSKDNLRDKIMVYFLRSKRLSKTLYSIENISKKMKIFKLFKIFKRRK